MNTRWVLLMLVCLSPMPLPAQRVRKPTVYLGAMGGLATLSGDGSSSISASSASASLFEPKNGAVAEAFAGIHLFRYVSFEGDTIWNRNHVSLVSTTATPGSTAAYQQPENVTQDAFLANVLIYFRKRGDRIRPYLSEGFGGVFIHSRSSGEPIVVGKPVLPPASSDRASIALRTLVGMDVQLRGRWSVRYTFGETIDRNTYGDRLTPSEHGLPKNFQNLFGAYFRF